MRKRRIVIALFERIGSLAFVVQTTASTRAYMASTKVIGEPGRIGRNTFNNIVIPSTEECVVKRLVVAAPPHRYRPCSRGARIPCGNIALIAGSPIDRGIERRDRYIGEVDERRGHRGIARRRSVRLHFGEQ